MKKLLAITVSFIALQGCTHAMEQQAKKEWDEVKSFQYKAMFKEIFGVKDVRKTMQEHIDYRNDQERYAAEQGCNPYMNNTREQTYNGVNDSYTYVHCAKMAYPNQPPKRLEGR